ncbi:hypothetical protein MIR68_005439 [Amoeboaphelidium protococcarum]|nr:hypothetical protein MIR68_005439 [Amoeboaphelidium protococcarum]
MMSPTKDTLIALLKRLKLVDLVNQLDQDIFTFEQMMRLNRAQWKETAGTVKGNFIHNHLHPTSAISGYSGSCAFGVGDGQNFEIIPLASMFRANYQNAKVVNIGASLGPYINQVDRIFVRDAYVKIFNAIYNNGNPPQWKVLVSAQDWKDALFDILCLPSCHRIRQDCVFGPIHRQAQVYNFT